MKIIINNDTIRMAAGVIMKIIINNDTIRMAAGVKSEVMSWGLHRVLVAVKSGV